MGKSEKKIRQDFERTTGAYVEALVLAVGENPPGFQKMFRESAIRAALGIGLDQQEAERRADMAFVLANAKDDLAMFRVMFERDEKGRELLAGLLHTMEDAFVKEEKEGRHPRERENGLSDCANLTTNT